MDRLKQMEDFRRGQTAQLILDNIAPYMKLQREKVLAKMKIYFGEGRSDTTFLLTGLAQLVALDDLEQELKYERNKGLRSAKEMNDESTQ